jgi:SAM-dependent methyltransferase
LNLGAYPANVSLHGIDLSDPALSIAAVRADRLGRQVVLTSGDAAILPYPDRSFDTIVATFVLCSVANVDATLRDAARVLRPGGTLRLLEHAQARHPLIAGLQRRSAPTWARASGGCRLDHDVSGAVRQAGLRVIDERNHAGGILVEIVADISERWGQTAPPPCDVEPRTILIANGVGTAPPSSALRVSRGPPAAPRARPGGSGAVRRARSACPPRDRTSARC